MSFPIFEREMAEKPQYQPEETAFEKKLKKLKEKRLQKLNSSRKKVEFTPKIRPHKPL